MFKGGYENGNKRTYEYEQDILTNYFDMLEDKLSFKRWYFGHYHDDFDVDDKHTLLYEDIVPLSEI